MIRDAGISDVGGIRGRMKSVPGFWDEAWRADHRERAPSGDTVALILLAGERIDGFACAHDVGSRAYLSELIVPPSAPGEGVGGRLLFETGRRMAARGGLNRVADFWPDAQGCDRSQGCTPPPVVRLRKQLDQAGARPTDIA